MESDKTTNEQLQAIREELETLRGEVYRNNFSSSQDFNKFIRFNTRMKVPHYDAIPPVGEVGEIFEAGGVLYICTLPNTFAVVGTQS